MRKLTTLFIIFFGFIIFSFSFVSATEEGTSESTVVPAGKTGTTSLSGTPTPEQIRETEKNFEKANPSGPVASGTPVPSGDFVLVEEVNSFELFWPIAAGKVRGERFYSLKSFKERVRGVFIFSAFKKADYNITLSEKRSVEAEKIFVDKKDLKNGNKTLEDAKNKRQNAYNLIQKAKDKGSDTTDLINRLRDSLEKQKKLLSFVASKTDNSEVRESINTNIESINSLLDKLQ